MEMIWASGVLARNRRRIARTPCAICRSVLPGSLGIARVVRADMEHNNSWMHPVQFSMIQAPEHVLNAVPAKPEIELVIRPGVACQLAGPLACAALGSPPQKWVIESPISTIRVAGL